MLHCNNTFLICYNKVYSIWICSEAAQKRANTIERYNINRTVYPEKKLLDEEPRYDLMEGIIINISKYHDTEDTNSELIRLLTDLFNENLSSKEKIRKFKTEYGLPTTLEFEREVDGMTAYSAGLIEKGMQRGIEEGTLTTLASLVIKGKIKVSDAAEQLDLTMPEFLERARNAGYKISD